MMINTNKYEFKNIEFRLPDDLEFLPSSNIPFFLKKMDLELDIISFRKDETKEGKYFHIAILNNTEELLDDFDEYFKNYMEEYNYNVLSSDKITIDGIDAIDFLAGSDDTPQMRYIILRREGKEFHFIFTTLTTFDNLAYYVETLINSLKFRD